MSKISSCIWWQPPRMVPSVRARGLDAQPLPVTYRGRPASGSRPRVTMVSTTRLGVSERFFRLVRRYGWYRPGLDGGHPRLADHRQSEAEQGGWHEGAGRTGWLQSARLSGCARRTRCLIGDRSRQAAAARLAWRPGDWSALTNFEASDAELIALLGEDLDSWKGAPCLELRYQKAKNAGRSSALPGISNRLGDTYRRYLESWSALTSLATGATSTSRRRSPPKWPGTTTGTPSPPRFISRRASRSSCVWWGS